MKKIFACAFLIGMCSFSVFADEYGEVDAWEVEGNECKKIKRAPVINGKCSGPNDSCTVSGATETKCVQVRSTPGAAPEWSCAATKCENGKFLWLGWNVNQWVSMGVCHDAGYCRCGTCKINGTSGTCVPALEMEKENHDKAADRYPGTAVYNRCMCSYDYGEVTLTIPGTIPNTTIGGACDNLDTPAEQQCCREAGNTTATEQYKCCVANRKNGQNVKWEYGQCNCAVGEWNPDSGICECEVDLSSDVKYTCKVGNTRFLINLTGGETLKIPVPVGIDQKCTELENKLNEHAGKMAEDIEWLNKICQMVTGSDSGLNGGGVSGGISQLDKWISGLESSKSKWKDAAGNFNGARLASDLTAGVVLGTVGGVVSGVVIKKKQVEKGFDALNCSVGGQKMANWGDEFRVEFRRY
ncbi:MAG: hypothetical protein IKN73_01800 [Alphaproteobacteria bacterium]|nr:hypothetical protein [Alphaproteobacteria bacterium]